MSNKKNKTATEISKKEGVYVYIGPSIRGVIQNATIYKGTKANVLKSISSALNKYPKIERLIIEDVYVAEARKKLTEKNSLSNAYHCLEKCCKGE